MNDPKLVDRLAALPNLADAPREELDWLVEHGTWEVLDTGAVVAEKGKRIRKLWVIVSGRLGVRVDRGAGPRRVIEWYPGDLAGMLPYSRMKGPPGDNYVEQRAELLTIHEDLFPEMVHRCPTVTTQAVHYMLDRARSFNSSDLQDEKMVSLGRLAAGLAHELNNPASATVRAAKVLRDDLIAIYAAVGALRAAGLTDPEFAAVEELRVMCAVRPTNVVLSPIERSDREDEVLDWLEGHRAEASHAPALAETVITIEQLDGLAAQLSGESLDAALRWIGIGCGTTAVAEDIERAATRISDLVGAVKRFTHMDNRAGPESVSIEPGLHDTLRVVAAKAKSKSAAISLDWEPDLPPVRANGGELNQIWLNLIDNALDAIEESGSIEIRGRKELDRVVVSVVDDGPGIPPDVVPHVFDPFFTTKPPGEGTGLGLEIARRLVRSYRGDLMVRSKPGRTEFRVSLPMDERTG
jgi:signal transduction histidine kinase